jgi:hypothetical protein
LEAGATPDVVAEWVRAEQTRKANAKDRLSRVDHRPPRMLGPRRTVDQLNDADLGDTFSHTGNVARTDFYAGLGLQVIYDPTDRTAAISEKCRRSPIKARHSE